MGIGNFLDSFSWATASPEERAQILANKKAELEYGDLLSSRGAQAKLIGGRDPQSGITWNPTQPPTGNYQQADATGQFQTMPVSGASPEAQNMLRPAYEGIAQDQNLLKAQAFPGAAAAQMQEAAYPSPHKIQFAPKGSQPFDETAMKPVGDQIPDTADNEPELIKMQKALAALPPGDPRRPAIEAWIAKNTQRPPSEGEPLVEIDDPNSPTGRKLVPRSQGIGQAGPQQNQQAPSQIENNLRDEFNKLTQPYRDITSAHSKIVAGATAKDDKGDVGTPAGDMGMIFGYMKILDPTSTVREGEYATAEQATGVPGAVLQLYNKALTGQKLTPAQRKDFVGRATDLVNSQKRFYDNTKSRYSEIAKNNRVNPANVVSDAPGLSSVAPPATQGPVAPPATQGWGIRQVSP